MGNVGCVLHVMRQVITLFFALCVYMWQLYAPFSLLIDEGMTLL